MFPLLVERSAADDRLPLSRLASARVPFVDGGVRAGNETAFSAATLNGEVRVSLDGRISYDVSHGRGPLLRESFVSGRPRPTGGTPSATRISDFSGNDPRLWRSGLRTFESVDLGPVWPGISVSLRARGGSVEKVFTVQPLARVDRIRIRLTGARRLDVGDDGRLVVGMDSGAVRLTPPTAWQDAGGLRHAVAVAYVVAGMTYGFRLGPRDAGAPVVIDPILQSSYIGGAGLDSANAMAVDPSTGDVIVAGHTSSNPSRGVDGFVARFDPTLHTLERFTYLGGGRADEILTVAIHPATGDVYVGGFTDSADFPGTSGGAQREYAANGDGFVARLDAALVLRGATYLGGAGDGMGSSGVEKIEAIAIHPVTGDVYVGGYTTSENLPGTTGGAQASPGPDTCNIGMCAAAGFVARYDRGLGTLTQATYFGASQTACEPAAYVRALAIHPSSGEILIGGQAGCDIPGTPGGAQSQHSGFNGFVSRLDPALARVLQSTFVSPDGFDDVRGIAVDPRSGDVLATGWKNGPGLPATDGAFQPVAAGENDGIVARFDSSLTRMIAATYFGSGQDDSCRSIAVDPSNGDVLVAGDSFSVDLPGTAGGAQPAVAGDDEAFVARFDPSLTRLVRSTYLGGSEDDVALAVAAHPGSGDVLVAGTTTSGNFPGAAGGAQPTYEGGSEVLGGDGFVSRLTPDLAGPSLPCSSDGDSLCLSGNRFRVHVDWHVPSQGRIGAGQPVLLSADTGYFWFFSDANIELVVKVLDARTVNGHFWVFYGALSNVEYTIAVTDTQTGVIRTYANPSGSLASVADTSAFAASVEGGAAADATAEPSNRRSAAELYAAYPASTLTERAVAEPINPCAAGGTKLCLNQERFQVGVEWDAPSQNQTGLGTAVPLTGDTGCFWFFSPGNVELVVKVLDGSGVNGHFWVFYGALSNVHYRITVTDTQTGLVKTYDNPSGNLASVADTRAF